MNRRLAFLTGGAAVAAAAFWRLFGRRSPQVLEVPEVTDPRAEALRARLDESRAVVDDREEFEAAETTVDEAEPMPSPDDRRRAVHAEGQSAVDRMRGATDE